MQAARRRPGLGRHSRVSLTEWWSRPAVPGSLQAYPTPHAVPPEPWPSGWRRSEQRHSYRCLVPWWSGLVAISMRPAAESLPRSRRLQSRGAHRARSPSRPTSSHGTASGGQAATATPRTPAPGGSKGGVEKPTGVAVSLRPRNHPPEGSSDTHSTLDAKCGWHRVACSPRIISLAPCNPRRGGASVSFPRRGERPCHVTG